MTVCCTLTRGSWTLTSPSQWTQPPACGQFFIAYQANTSQTNAAASWILIPPLILSPRHSMSQQKRTSCRGDLRSAQLWPLGICSIRNFGHPFAEPEVVFCRNLDENPTHPFYDKEPNVFALTVSSSRVLLLILTVACVMPRVASFLLYQIKDMYVIFGLVTFLGLWVCLGLWNKGWGETRVRSFWTWTSACIRVLQWNQGPSSSTVGICTTYTSGWKASMPEMAFSTARLSWMGSKWTRRPLPPPPPVMIN